MLIRIPEDLKLYTLKTQSGEAVEVWSEDEDPPEGVTVQGPPETLTFVRHLLKRHLFRDPSWGVSYESGLMLEDIAGAFNGKKAGDVVELPRTQYEKLLSVMKAPAGGYSVVLLPKMMPWLRAIEQATEKNATKPTKPVRH